jgi:hypothetical protein
MGLFYTRQKNIAAAVGPRLRAAHLAAAAQPDAANTATETETTAIEQETRPEFSVPRGAATMCGQQARLSGGHMTSVTNAVCANSNREIARP